MSQPARRQYWKRRCAMLALRVNAAAWMESFAPAAFTVVSAAAIALYALRRLREPLGPIGWLLLGALLIAALVAFWRQRKALFGLREARVFLEYQLGLDAALSAAQAGIAPWPGRIAREPRLLKFRSLASFAWLGACVVLLLASLQLPVPPPARNLQAAGKSPSLAEVENLIEELKQSDLVDAASLERLAAEARQLGNRPLEQQYSHSALEAADQLRDQTLSATNDLAKNFEDAAKTLDDAEKKGQGMSDADAKQAAQALKAAMQGMRNGQLAANEKLSSQLRGMDGSKMRQLSQSQLSQLKQRMSQAGQGARGISGAAKKSQVARGDGGQLQPGQGQGQGMGQGGPGGGGGPAPLAFNENASPELAGKGMELGNEDYSRAAFGDTLQTTNGKHEIDPTKSAGPQSAGAVSSQGQGGDAVWVNRLTPSERAALKDFFK